MFAYPWLLFKYKSLFLSLFLGLISILYASSEHSSLVSGLLFSQIPFASTDSWVQCLCPEFKFPLYPNLLLSHLHRSGGRPGTWDSSFIKTFQTGDRQWRGEEQTQKIIREVFCAAQSMWQTSGGPGWRGWSEKSSLRFSEEPAVQRAAREFRERTSGTRALRQEGAIF